MKGSGANIIVINSMREIIAKQLKTSAIMTKEEAQMKIKEWRQIYGVIF